jgi:hypothetical protein
MKPVRRTNIIRRLSRLDKVNQKCKSQLISMGLEAAESGLSAVGHKFDLPRQNVWYWKQKALNPDTFHASELGGPRGKCFLPENVQLIKQTLWEAVQKDPTLRLSDYRNIVISTLQLYAQGPNCQKTVSESYLSNIFFSWKWR